MTDTDRALRRFRFLLRLYPASYRDRYGHEMEAFFAQEIQDGAAGPAFWVRLAVDHTRAALAVRRRRDNNHGTLSDRAMNLLQELRFAARALRRAPTFTLFAVCTLALGVAATTTVFTILDRVVLRALPYPDADRLVVIGSEFQQDPGGVGPLSVAQITDLMENPGPAERIVGVTSIPMTISGLGEPERTPVNQISEGFFELFGATAIAGRLLDDRDQVAGSEHTAVIEHAFWVARFGSAPDVVGRVFSIEDEPHVVVGVLSPDFVRPESVAGDGPIWVAARFAEGRTSAGSFSITAVGLLPPGVSPGVVDDFVDDRFAEIHSFLSGGTVLPHRDHVVDDIGDRLMGAFGGVLLLLLIACANVASLTITRGQERAREFSVRTALGAGRRRLILQLATESVLLAAMGGALGAGLAFGAVELFRAQAPAGIPRIEELSLDGWGLAAAIGVSLATSLLFGLLPALFTTSRTEAGLGRANLRSTGGRRVARVRAGLVLAETALAVVLVVGSGLLAKDLIRLSTEDPGFDPNGLTSMHLNVSGRVAGDEETSTFWTRLMEEAAAIPGVSEVALASQLPYDGVSSMRSLAPEVTSGDREEAFVAQVFVTPNYFSVVDIPVVDGRTMTRGETQPGSLAVLVNEAFTRRYWQDGSPVGRRVGTGEPMDGSEETFYSVVGVVADVRTRAGVDAPPQIFFPIGSDPHDRADLIVKGGASATNATALREVVSGLDPGLPVGRIETLESIASQTLDRPRFYTGLFGGFALVALLLALVGVYGTTAYATRSRTREIGIRLALGAVRARLVGTIVRSTANVLAVGVGIGLAISALATRAMADVLFYVTPLDALTYLGVGALVLTTGAVAAWLPASRSSHVDPATTLREE